MKILISLLLLLTFPAPLPAQQDLTTNQQREIRIARKLINDKRNTTLAYNMSFTNWLHRSGYFIHRMTGH